jgi:Flp pilus assembly protein TadG
MPDKLRDRNRRGQTVLLLTGAIIPLAGLVGLVTDIGYMHYVQRSAQKAADAAVLAAIAKYNTSNAGSAFNCPASTGDPTWPCNNPTPYMCAGGLTGATNPVEDACLYAQLNGFDPAANTNQKVTINSSVNVSSTNPIPTAIGVNNGAWWITARVAQKVPNLFSAVLGNNSGWVDARASAAIQPGLACVYALDPVAQGTYYQNGNTTFNANCGIYVNSNNASAAMLGNGGSSVTATSIQVVGGVSWQGSISPTPQTNISPFPDPLRNLPTPSQCGYATTGCDSANCPNNSKPFVVSSDTTLSPGTYCGGIFVKSGTATFSQGRYIIVGGGIGTQDTNSIIVANNVFIYNTYDKHNTFAPINFSANSSEQMSAPNDDPPYSGILYFEDRQCCTASGMQTDSFQGGATSYFQGTIYAAPSLVQFAGNPSLGVTSTQTAKYTVVVARRFSVQGTSMMSNDFSNVTGGNPIKVVALVE